LKVGMRTIGEDDHSIDFDDASSLKGKEPEEIERAIPADWSKNPVRSGPEHGLPIQADPVTRFVLWMETSSIQIR
jgi:hypothetical protein